MPLSYAQQRLWFLNTLEGPNATYNTALSLRLNGPLDPGVCRSALDDVARRHETLRTVFAEDEQGPHQRVLDPGTGLPGGWRLVRTTRDRLAGELTEESSRGFDLEREPAWRATLFRVDESEHVLLLVVHHITADGWSLPVFLADFSTAFRARSGGGAPQWRALPVQYADYSLWQRDVLGAEDDAGSPIARQLGFWERELEGL
ncbi:condensation domain-containing protein, partial [Streptomyces globisporus]|nr:condensation domain-containing protein [Streptomyces globisporus]